MATLAELLQSNPWGYGAFPETGPVDPTGSARQWTPTAGEDEAFRLRQTYGPVGHRMAPMAQMLIDHGGLPGAIASGVMEQPAKTGNAIEKAVKDPSIESLTNAGVQTGMSVGSIPIALGSLGAGYAVAGAKQAGIDPLSWFITDAMAKSDKKGAAPKLQIADLPGLTPEQNSEYKLTRQRIDSGDFENGAARRSLEENRKRLETLSDSFVGGNIKLEQEAKARKEKDAQETYARSVKAAEAKRDAVRATDTQFKDSPVGKVYESTGGYTPMLMAVGGGLMHGLKSIKDGAGSGIMSNVVTPALEGTGLTFAGLNAPLVHNSFSTPVSNPQKDALRAYVMDAPDGDPKRAQYERELAKTAAEGGMPDINPVQDKAWSELTNPYAQARRLWSAFVEGAPAAITGRNIPDAVIGAAKLKGKMKAASAYEGADIANAEGAQMLARLRTEDAARQYEQAARIRGQEKLVADEVQRRSGSRMADVLENGGSQDGLTQPVQRQLPPPATSSNQAAVTSGPPTGANLSSVLQGGQDGLTMTLQASPQLESLLSRLLTRGESTAPPIAPHGSHPVAPPVAPVAPGAGSWASNVQPTARDVLLSRADAGGGIGKGNGADILRRIDNDMPPPAKRPSKTDVNTRLANLRDVLGDNPTRSELEQIFSAAPDSVYKGKKIPAIVATGATGALAAGGEDADAADVHHSVAQPRDKGGRFKGAPDKDALDRAIARAMGAP